MNDIILQDPENAGNIFNCLRMQERQIAQVPLGQWPAPLMVTLFWLKSEQQEGCFLPRRLLWPTAWEKLWWLPAVFQPTPLTTHGNRCKGHQIPGCARCDQPKAWKQFHGVLFERSCVHIIKAHTGCSSVLSISICACISVQFSYTYLGVSVPPSTFNRFNNSKNRGSIESWTCRQTMWQNNCARWLCTNKPFIYLWSLSAIYNSFNPPKNKKQVKSASISATGWPHYLISIQLYIFFLVIYLNVFI